MEPLISLRDVSFSAQNLEIVSGVTLDFAQGETTALVGPSGCGKSTLIKLCAGLLIPSKGEVLYRGQNIAAMNRRETLSFRREGAVVFQDSALWANQNLDQILNLPLQVHYPEMGKEARQRRIMEVMAEGGCKRDLELRPAALSMGEQKLVAFARAMLCRPTVLFLDEWTESLDDKSEGRLVALVKSRQEAHNTIIFVSHDEAVVKNLAQRVVLIHEGRLATSLRAEQIAADCGLAALLEGGAAP